MLRSCPISLHMWFLLEAEVGKKNVLRELEVGNTPVFVAFGLLLLFFPYREKSVPHGQLQSREALDGTIAPKCISPVLQGDKNTCSLTLTCSICVDFVVGLTHSCVFTLSRSYAVAPALSHSAYRRARSRVYHSPLSVSRSFSLSLSLSDSPASPFLISETGNLSGLSPVLSH